jgi:Mg-chelatase subunit ChlD
MKRMTILLVVVVLIAAQRAYASGAAEASAGSGQRTQYLVERGVIVPSEEIHTNSYIAAINYHYPLPESDLGVYLYNGNRQLSVSGQDDILQIGIQAAKTDFEDLTPMNLAFVIDHSGSMSSADKLDWVKDAFDIFINQVRDTDYVSLVIFDDKAEVIFPATKMDTRERRRSFQRAVHSVQPGGSTNLRDGLRLGCLEVVKNANAEYTNRVMFLSDGCDTVGNSHESILDVARQFAQLGVTISTIGVGESFDLNLMVDMAKVGEGSSRFISDREEMEKTFGSELDRMVVAQARDLEMTLEFLVDAVVLDTWGYENRRSGSTVRYYQPTLHHGDYETILVRYRTKPQRFTGTMDLARFTIEYEDVYGNRRKSGPHVLQATFVENRYPVVGISDGMVLRSGSVLHLAQNLKTVGELYYSGKSRTNLQRALDLTVDTKKELVNAMTRLDNEGFSEEIDILNRYINILCGELQLTKARTNTLVSDVEIAPFTPQRSFSDHADNLCREIVLDLRTRSAGVVAVCGFASQGADSSQLVSQLSELAYREVARIPHITIVEESALISAIDRHGYRLAELTDKLKAVKVGEAAMADYILTGTVMEMTDSTIIFTRLLNVRSGEVESAAQIIMPR